MPVLRVHRRVPHGRSKGNESRVPTPVRELIDAAMILHLRPPRRPLPDHHIHQTQTTRHTAAPLRSSRSPHHHGAFDPFGRARPKPRHFIVGRELKYFSEPPPTRADEREATAAASQSSTRRTQREFDKWASGFPEALFRWERRSTSFPQLGRTPEGLFQAGKHHKLDSAGPTCRKNFSRESFSMVECPL